MREWKKKRGFGQRSKRVSFAELCENYEGEATEILFAERMMGDDDDDDTSMQTAREESDPTEE